VIGADGPIKGLYAAGDIAASRYINDRYHKKQITNDYSWAIASGFMAGSNASDFLHTTTL
jgi:thioredoxin reductase